MSQSVYDTDERFIINPITREITSSSVKKVLVQHDHNSERITFEIPRIVDGQDISLCNVAQVHYLNIDAATNEQYHGLYSIEDLRVDVENPEIVIGSWLVSRNATRSVGSLFFIVRFASVDNDGSISYDWHTAIYRKLTVGSGINNTEVIAEKYADILAQWEIELKALNISVLDGRVTSAEEDITNLQKSVKSNADNIASLQTTTSTNTANISTLRSDYDSDVFSQKNLLPNARTLDGTITTEAISEEYIEGIGKVNVAKAEIKSDSTESYGEALKFYRKITPLSGATYTLSFYAKGSNVNVVFYSGLYNVKTAFSSQGKQTTSVDGSVQFNLTSKWQRYYVIYTLKDTAESVSDVRKSVGFNVMKSTAADAEVYIAAPQLVLGSDVLTDIEKLQQRDIERDIKKYSVSFSSSLSAGTRLDDAVGMRADVQIGTDASGVVNDFDNVSFFNRPICCCSWDSTNHKWRVNAYEGEPGFARDGSNGEIMYECTPFWYKADFEGEGAPHYVSVTGTPCEGYTLAPMFKNGYDKVYCSSYWMSMVDGKPTSRSGVYSTYGSLNLLMSNARTLDEKAHLETIEMLFSDYLLMLVEFATKDFQTVMLGASGMRYDSNDIITNISYSDKLDVSNITLNGVNKSMYTEGQTISVGSTKNSENHVTNCKVLYVNGDESVCVITVDTTDSKIAVGDYVSSRPWINGATDFITASSGTMANTGRYPCIWRGKVDPWGDVFSNICNLLVKRYGDGTTDSPYSYRLQYLPEPWKYTDGAITSDYIEANFDLATRNGYVKTLSSDSRYPHIIGTTAIGASSTNYAAAYYYAPNGDVRTVRSGGFLADGRTCSPVYFICSVSPSGSNWACRARLFCSP